MKMRTGLLLATASGMLGAVIAAGYIERKRGKELEWCQHRINKFQGYFDVTNEWLKVKKRGDNLSDYFTKNEWKKIAIYGMGELGNRLMEELEGSEVKILYFIDKYKKENDLNISVYDITADLPEVDVIVVTPFFSYDEIEEQLMDKVDYPIISIEEIVLH